MDRVECCRFSSVCRYIENLKHSTRFIPESRICALLTQLLWRYSPLLAVSSSSTSLQSSLFIAILLHSLTSRVFRLAYPFSCCQKASGRLISWQDYLLRFLYHARPILAFVRVKKSKAVPLHALEALWGGGERRYSSYLGSRCGEWSASRPGRAVPSGKGPHYPLYRRLGGPQSRSGHRG
jgi:hypothetical protein